MAWTAPKTDWDPADGVTNTHLNAIGDNLNYLKAHEVATGAVHGAVAAATASTLVLRDANGRTKMAAPSDTDDVAIKATVTAEQTRAMNAESSLAGLIDAIEAAYLPLLGGTMLGSVVGHVDTDYTTGRFRNIFLSTAAPTTEGNNGDVWIQYEV